MMKLYRYTRVFWRLLLSLALLLPLLNDADAGRAARAPVRQPLQPAQAWNTGIRGEQRAAERRAVVSWDEIVQADQQRFREAAGQRETPWMDEPLTPAPLPGGEGAMALIPDLLPSAGLTPPQSEKPEVASPPPASSFLALGDNNAVIPPDTHGTPGPNHLMVTLNTQVRIQNRSGSNLSTVLLNSFWASVNDNAGAFDPRILYDPYSSRWIFVACDDAPPATASGLLIGASQTSDPTGLWNLYRIKAADTIWIDYPSIGFNKNWVVVSTNIFTAGGIYVRRDIFAFDKADLYKNDGTGEGLHTPFSDFGSGGSWAPAVTYDNSLEQLYLLQVYSSDSGQVRLATISGAVGAEVFSTAVTGWMVYYGSGWSSQNNSSRTDFAPQLGSLQKIQTNDSRMQNVVYRNGSLWATHTIFLPAGGAPTRSSVQWWQIAPNNPPAAPPAALQTGRVDDASGVNFYAYPSIAVNQNNDLLLGYSRFSTAQYASGNYAYRAAGDPAGTLRADTVLKAGEAPYYKVFSSSRNRWGDYSHTYVDPLNDLDFWTIQEYAALPSGGYDRWSTWWGKIVPPPVAFGKSAPANGAADQDPGLELSWSASSSNTAYEYCLDSTNNNTCDTSWSSTLTDTSVTPPGLGSSQTYYWQARAVNAGGTVEADGGAWWNFTTASLPPQAFAKSTPADGAAGQSTSPALSWGVSAGAASYAYCIDMVAGSTCDGIWMSTNLNTSVQLSGLNGLATYYWQVRAVNGLGTTEADGGNWGSFTTAALPGAFSKSTPGDGVTGQAKNPLLTWAASSGVASYQYCVDQVNDGACAGSWITVTGSTSVQLSGLQAATRYYWQVRANNSGGTTYANGGFWWSFTTLYDPPGAFSKSSPANSSSLQPFSLTLQWGSSAGALAYEYCLDDTANGICNSAWISTGLSTSAAVSGLSPLTLYSWQARATNLGGTVLANSGAWWSFTTEATPAGPFDKLAPASGLLDLPTTLTLTWSASSGAASYDYCLDTVNDASCNGPWVSAGTQLSVTVSGLKFGTLYYWQVRALKAGANPTHASGGTWWQFQTAYTKYYLPWVRKPK